LHISWIQFDINLDVNLSKFVKSIDPLKDFQMVKLLQNQLFRSNFDSTSLPCTSTTNWSSVVDDPSFLFDTALLQAPTSNDTVSDSFGFLTKPDDLPIVLDTGASTTLTLILSDFIGPLEPAPLSEIRGLTATTKVVGRGKVQWTIRDYWNVTGVIETDASYVPDASICLFSPQYYFQEYQHSGGCIIQGMKTTLELPNATVLEFPYNPGSNLPLMLPDQPVSAGLGCADLASFLSTLSTLLSVTDQTNQNLRPAQKELLLWHFKLGHVGFHWCQKLCRVPTDPFREQVIVPKHSKVSSCDAPLCTACQLSKQTRRFPEIKTQVNPAPTICKANLQPGDYISVDQYVSALTGRLPHRKGKESKDDQYHGGTLFVDHASGYIYLRNQISLTAGETLRSKKAFEQFAASVGVTLKEFRADNVPFNSAEFRRNLQANGQIITFSGTGAHHQNGVAECAIQTVTRWARAMLLHSILLWPDTADLALWLFALTHAVYLWNNLPSKQSSLAPLEIFSRTRFPNYHHLRRLHVWGCPAYVLDPNLQDGKKLPKWSPRSRRGKFLGISPTHSSTTGLVLNLRTGHVSPQYHVVYDDEFTTVPNAESGGLFNAERPFDADRWQNLVKAGTERVIVADDVELPPLHRDWEPPPPP
jgi:hypothetical protein